MCLSCVEFNKGRLTAMEAVKATYELQRMAEDDYNEDEIDHLSLLRETLFELIGLYGKDHKEQV